MARNLNAELASIAMQVSFQGGRPQPTLIVGVPGTGKTQFIEGLSNELEKMLRQRGKLREDESFETLTFTIPQTSPDGLEGMGCPNKDMNELNYLPRAALRRVNAAKFGLVFGDELSSGSDETGASFMAFAQDGRAGDLTVHNRVCRIFAMNPAECAAAGRELTPPEANRFLFIKDWTIPVDDFIDYLRGGPGMLSHVRVLPDGWEADYGSRTKSMLASFLDTHRHMINELDVSNSLFTTATKAKSIDPSDARGAWTSQRSLINGFRMLAACMSLGESMDSQLCRLALEGCVGKNFSDEFFSWVESVDLPDPEVFLKDPAGTANLLPERSDRRKLVLEQIATAAIRKSFSDLTDQNETNDRVAARWEAAWNVIGPAFEKRRDDAYGACVILQKNTPQNFLGKQITNVYVKMFFDILKLSKANTEV